LGKIFMVRHGQASFGKKNYDNLSEKGREQSRILAEYMIRTGISFQAVYTGELLRQKDTAGEVIQSYRAHGLTIPDIQILPEFNEYRSREIMMAYMHDVAQEDPDLQAAIGNLYEDRKAFGRLFKKVMLRWVSGEAEKPDVVSWRDFRDGVRSGMRKVMAVCGLGDNVLICSSGGAISAAVQMALDLSNEKAFGIAWHIVNTSVTTFAYNDGQLALASFNQQAHLDLVNHADWVTYW